MSTVVTVSSSSDHSFSKKPVDQIELIAGIGVAGDAHAGKTVQHLSRVAKDPTQPNLRQVHLLHTELLDDLNLKGFKVYPGDIGENILTRGVDLLGLATGTKLHIGSHAVVEVTGLRNPCKQIETFQSGLLSQVVSRDTSGHVVRIAGVMSIVLTDGMVLPGDNIHIEPPPAPHRPLEYV